MDEAWGLLPRKRPRVQGRHKQLSAPGACLSGVWNSSQMAWWVLTLTGVDLRTGLPYPENLSCLFITLGSIQMRSDSKRARCQNTPLANVLEKEMATHSSVLAWRIPRAEEPAGLPSMGSHKVRYNWGDLAASLGCSSFLHVFLIPLSTGPQNQKLGLRVMTTMITLK